MSSWNQVNQNLIAKAIGELVFEENINIEESNTEFSFKTAQNISYSFTGKKSLWGWIKVDPASILRNGQKAVSASQFFIDTQEFTKMSDITLAQFIEEMRPTLFADLHLNHEVGAEEFIKLNFLESQQLLNGHPKILLNKGRLGWSIEDWKNYAPENRPLFPLKLLAIRTSLLRGKIPSQSLYLELVMPERLVEISHNVDFEEYTLIPVHPWQWKNVIYYHFQTEIQNRDIIDVGETSFHFSPQTSLRTLNCIERLENYEIKLPLSILNTSCIRGLPAKSIEIGVKISKGLNEIIDQDNFLKNKVKILAEVAGVNYVAKDLAQIKGAPYRFSEFLGVIWRESAFSKVQKEESIILTANLLFQDKNQHSSLAAYIKASGLTAKNWIREYTRTVILPLLHLQLHHGIGIVSHGQNIMLILKDNRPHQLVIKDFQGDFRFSESAPVGTRNIFKDIFKDITHLPPQHLIHDLYTAHFVTFLRYVGMNLNDEDIITESVFYKTISEEVSQYENQFPHNLSLNKEFFEKILVNSVRFKIGYGDSAERPLPLLGTTISNPLHQVNL
ncbi:MAG TPA: IucA/IucC family protein [Bacteriovoracaceae bacterium]|nr:IucA/IucC family protein [Bacteriovoracaceae bacterium]